MNKISVAELALWQDSGFAFELIDVRRARARDADGSRIPGALWRDPEQWLDWKAAVSRGQPLVVVCAQGHEISQSIAAGLCAMGLDARYLIGGVAGWKAADRQVQPLRLGEAAAPSKWVTRERPKIDRIACPWLVTRFIDDRAQFLYVPAGEVLTVARETGAVPYDVPGVELTHVGESCSFDAFIAKYALNSPALAQLALIVRGADTARLDLTPQSAGLLAMSQGLSRRFADDQEMLRHGLFMYDTLYAWCLDCQDGRQSS